MDKQFDVGSSQSRLHLLHFNDGNNSVVGHFLERLNRVDPAISAHVSWSQGRQSSSRRPL